MAKIALNKSSLTKQKNLLKSYEQFLPSLELKQQQLKAIEAKAKKQYLKIEDEMKQQVEFIKDRLPMIANDRINLNGLISLGIIEKIEENLLGLRLPALKEVHFKTVEYSHYNTLHWLDNYIENMKEYLIIKTTLEVQKERLAVIAKAVLKITQRVNLFDKILIPTTKENIKKINISLSDDERAAVVRSKIAKAMHEKEHEEDTK